MAQKISITLIIILGAVSVFGFYIGMDHMMYYSANCPFLSNQAICPNMINHLLHWQALFSFNFTENIISILNFISFFLIILSPVTIFNLSNSKRLLFSSQKSADSAQNSFLKIIFSQGILHPKIY